jgi:hypothetical protein
MAAAPASASARIVDEPGMGRLEIFQLAASEAVLRPLLTDLFRAHWQEIVFGTLVQGAVFEIRAPNAPKHIGYLDGYLTVDFGAWHFHVCIGPHKEAAPAVAAIRPTARAELYRRLDADGAANGWGLRLFNGRDEQQMTVFLPHPYIDPGDKVRKEADWSRLALWDRLRREYLGLEPDACDRKSPGFRHG